MTQTEQAILTARGDAKGIRFRCLSRCDNTQHTMWGVEYFTCIGRFCPAPPALPHIKGLGWTKTHDNTFAVLGGFWHDAA